VTEVIDLGRVIELTLEVGSGLELRARSLVDLGLAPGATCHVGVDADALSFWEAPAPDDAR
jgi:hypothetical protein